MAVETGIGKRVAELIERDLDAIAPLIVGAYLNEYPEGVANAGFDNESLYAWTKRELADLLEALSGGNPAARSHSSFEGDMGLGVDPVMQPIATFVEARLFIARTLAPIIWRRFVGDTEARDQAVSTLEAATLQLIRMNIASFAENDLPPNCLKKDWNLVSPGRAVVRGREDAGLSARRHQADLSPRELEVVRMVAAGMTNGEIATSLRLSQNTVKNHIARIFDKLSVSNRAELTRKAIDTGLV